MSAGMPLWAADGSPDAAACTIVNVTTASAASITATVTPDTPRCPFLLLWPFSAIEIALRDIRTNISCPLSLWCMPTPGWCVCEPNELVDTCSQPV